MVDKLMEECTENIDEVKFAEIALFEHGNECVCAYTICVILTVIALTISIGIGAYFAYKYINHRYLKKTLFVLSLVPVLNGIALKQQFNECNSIELINGEKSNKYRSKRKLPVFTTT